MAECHYCEQEMSGDGVGCTMPKYGFENESLDRIPNGGTKCHDCHCPPNTLHHPGCDMERCPKCEGQAIGCECDG